MIAPNVIKAFVFVLLISITNVAEAVKIKLIASGTFNIVHSQNTLDFLEKVSTPNPFVNFLNKPFSMIAIYDTKLEDIDSIYPGSSRGEPYSGYYIGTVPQLSAKLQTSSADATPVIFYAKETYRISFMSISPPSPEPEDIFWWEVNESVGISGFDPDDTLFDPDSRNSLDFNLFLRFPVNTLPFSGGPDDNLPDDFPFNTLPYGRSTLRLESEVGELFSIGGRINKLTASVVPEPKSLFMLIFALLGVFF